MIHNELPASLPRGLIEPLTYNSEGLVQRERHCPCRLSKLLLRPRQLPIKPHLDSKMASPRR